MEEALRNMKNYIRRVNRKRKQLGLPNARYVYVTECSPSGRWHHHIVMDGDLDMDTVESLWTKGKRNQVRRLEKDENGLSGMAHYLTKEPKGTKRWTPSKGLRQPSERVNHQKFQRKEVRQMIEDADTVKPLMEKWYAAEGYVYTSSVIRYNDVNGRFYIYARLRKPPDKKQRKEGQTWSRSKRQSGGKPSKKGGGGGKKRGGGGGGKP